MEFKHIKSEYRNTKHLFIVHCILFIFLISSE